MASKQQKHPSTNGSIRVEEHDLRGNSPHINGAGVMVGENREHFSLLQSNRRQLHRKHNYKSVRVSSMVGGSEPTSGDEGEDEGASEDSAASNISVLMMKNRMTGYFRLMRSRYPRGKGVLLVLTIAFLETFSFFGALTGVRRLLPFHDHKCHSCSTDLESFVLSLLYSSAGRIFYPVAGVIADSYLGRYKVIHIGLWLLWIGFAINTLAFSFLHSIPSGFAGEICKYIVAVLSVILFSAGSGSVEATVIPFGVDQLAQGSSSDEISSYFYYYYIVRNVAGLVATVILLIVFDVISFFPHSDHNQHSKAYNFNMDIDYIVQNLLALLAVTAALLVLFYFKNQFYRDKQHSNALKSVTRVLCYAARVKRQLPQRNRAFRYGGALTPRIDLAKTEFDGNFSGEEVEEVKTFYRMLLLILSLFGYFITYGAGFAYISSTLSMAAIKGTIAVSSHKHVHHYLANNVIWIVNTGIISAALPIINHLLIPIRPTVNIRLKIGIGFLLHVLAFAIAVFIQWKQDHVSPQHFFYLMVLPTVLLSIGETIVFVSSLEFIYAQSPNNMKGLQTGMFYLIYGIFSAIGSTIYFVYPIHLPYRHTPAVGWSLFCVVLFSVGFVGLLVYSIMAWCYKNRQRPATDEAEVQRILMYANVYGSKS